MKNLLLCAVAATAVAGLVMGEAQAQTMDKSSSKTVNIVVNVPKNVETVMMNKPADVSVGARRFMLSPGEHRITVPARDLSMFDRSTVVKFVKSHCPVEVVGTMGKGYQLQTLTVFVTPSKSGPVCQKAVAKFQKQS